MALQCITLNIYHHSGSNVIFHLIAQHFENLLHFFSVTLIFSTLNTLVSSANTVTPLFTSSSTSFSFDAFSILSTALFKKLKFLNLRKQTSALMELLKQNQTARGKTLSFKYNTFV